MAAVIVGLIDRVRRLIACNLEHIVGKVVIAEMITASGMSNRNLSATVVVLGERNKGMNGIQKCSPIPHNSRVFRFGNKCSLMAPSWMTEKTSKGGNF